jgi:hypothetical protein
MLAEGMDGNRACTQCHTELASKPSEHTHHAPDSPGSQCVSCHMPKTTYALLKSIRSHRITSPYVPRHAALGADEAQNDGAPPPPEADTTTGAPPNDAPGACNLCHLDESVAWAKKKSFDFWGSPEQKTESALAAPPAVPSQAPPADELPASVRYALAGNAAQRVLLADAFADENARQASGSGFQRAVLERLTHDPYAAVRFVAARSLARLGAPDQKLPTPAWLRPETLDALQAARNDEPITISE